MALLIFAYGMRERRYDLYRHAGVVNDDGAGAKGWRKLVCWYALFSRVD